MPRIKTSPHYQFSQPLLNAMNALTNGKANVRVRHIDATTKMCELLGISLDHHGKQEQTGQFWTVRWASLAMLDHKASGLMDYPSKGWWVLTPAGVAQVAAYNGMTTSTPVAPVVVASVAPAAPVAPVVKAAPAPVTVEVPEVQEPQAVEAFVAAAGPALADLDAMIPPSVEQLVDSYFVTLQMASTACFSQWSGRSDSCKSCPLASKCYDAFLVKMAMAANELAVEEAAPAITPVPKGVAPSIATAGLNINSQSAKKADDLKLDLDSTPPVKAKASGFQVAGMIEMVAAGEAKCVVCGGIIAQGEKAAYSRKSGFAHTACANKGGTP